MRIKILPCRAQMSAQRPGQALSESTLDGGRAFVFRGKKHEFDYLTQLPSGEHELMFGGRAAPGGKFVLSEVGNTNDGGYDMSITSYVTGILPHYFGIAHWGTEGAPSESALRDEWGAGRIKATWTGLIGFSVDQQPWVGRLPANIAGRPAPLPGAPRGVDVTESGTKTTTKHTGSTTAPPGEWIVAGFTGEGMVHAWMCGRALAYMVLGAESEERLSEWFPDVYRVTEKRWKMGTMERLMNRL